MKPAKKKKNYMDPEERIKALMGEEVPEEEETEDPMMMEEEMEDEEEEEMPMKKKPSLFPSKKPGLSIIISMGKGK